MRANVVMSVLLMMIAGGCAPSFTGQWLEERAERAPTTGISRDYVRMALDFDPISSVRIGIYNETAGVVDDESVQQDQYVIYDGGKVAQFGAAYAKLETGDKMVANVAGTARTFNRVKGHGIFPPLVRLPSLIKADPPAPDRFAKASP